MKTKQSLSKNTKQAAGQHFINADPSLSDQLGKLFHGCEALFAAQFTIWYGFFTAVVSPFRRIGFGESIPTNRTPPPPSTFNYAWDILVDPTRLWGWVYA
ncbi:MAG TPA: hypothetical protein VMF91_03945 [Bryobacteraceae bacterium]|nr:hypothetical protein [Bryobacteraceae bacterium]